MTRIAYLVSDYFAPSHTFVRREVEALGRAGIEIVAFSVQRSAHKDTQVQSILKRSALEYPIALLRGFLRQPRRFISVWCLALSHRPPGLRALIWSQFHFVEAMMLARLIKAADCTRLHNHFANSAATVGMMTAKFLEIPWSLTLHGISETDYPAGLLLPRKLEAAEFVACASYFMQAQAMRVVDFKHWSKMHIVRCGVDLSNIPPPTIDSETSENAQPIKLICVGRLSAEKGYFGLLAVLARLARVGHEFSVVIIGDGPSAEAIHAEVTKLALDSRVRFTGALPEGETLEEINRSDVLVLPSLMEGLPVVLIEALAMGKAVIASQVAGIPELISEGQTGLLFIPSNWEHLESQLRRILTNPMLRKSLGSKGSNVVTAEFRIDQAARNLSALFEGKVYDQSLTTDVLGS